MRKNVNLTKVAVFFKEKSICLAQTSFGFLDLNLLQLVITTNLNEMIRFSLMQSRKYKNAEKKKAENFFYFSTLWYLKNVYLGRFEGIIEVRVKKISDKQNLVYKLPTPISISDSPRCNNLIIPTKSHQERSKIIIQQL